MDTEIREMRSEIEEIKRRNKRVETDKAWERSYTRRALITIFTYLSIGTYLDYIKIPDPWLNAIVPSVAFILSTLTLPWFRKMWEDKIYRREKGA